MAVQSKGRVLIVDNDPKVGRDLQALLEPLGYRVHIVQEVGQALLDGAVAIAHRFRPHVAVVDLRLLEEESDDDRSGLQLLKSFQSAHSILYSAYLTSDITREAHRRYRATWVDKGESPQNLLDEVAEAAQESCAFQKGLNLHWPSAWTLPRIVGALFGKNTDVPPDVVEDILGQLFPEHREIVLGTVGGEVATTPSVSRGGSILIRASPFRYEPVILRLARAEQVRSEAKNFHQYARGRLKGQYTDLERSVKFWDLGGAIYRFLGWSSRPLSSFTVFYRREKDPEVILKPLRRFFEEVWSQRYDPKLPDKALPLFYVYDRALQLKERLEGFSRQEERLQFPGLSASLINPVPWVLQHAGDSLISGARQAISHGDLHGDNLFVNGKHAWAIGFERTGSAHTLRDFVELEVDIVTRLLLTEVDLLLFHELAVVLAGPSEPIASFRPDEKLLANPEIRKALDVIAGLRSLAYELTHYSDSREYLWGLLLDALFVATEVSEESQRERALLLGAVLCNRLWHWGEEWPRVEWEEIKRGRITALSGSPLQELIDPTPKGDSKMTIPVKNLLKAVSNRKAVLFVGSGMSREGGLPSARQLTELLAEEIRHELEPATNLARIAQYVQIEPGFGRGWLINLLREKLSSVHVATSHRLVPRFPWAAVYTTNYDTLLEEGYRAEGGGYRKVLYSSAFRNIPAGTTPIVKIHGCIEYGDSPDVRLIITEDDYAEFERHRKGLIAELKHFLYRGASIVFVGYGLADDNLWSIYEDVRKELGDHLQYSYAVMPETSARERRRLEKKQIVLLPYTAKAFFLTLAEQLGVSTVV